MIIPINPSRLPIVGGGAAVVVPSGSSGVEIENYADGTSTGDFTVTTPNGTTFLVKMGTTKSFGVSTNLCRMEITAPAGATGQVIWL